MHVPQSYEASTELAEIAAVPHQIVTPRHAKPLIGIVQDTLVGSYRITQPQVEFTRREYMNMMMWNKRFEGRIPRPARGGDGSPARWSGQQVLTQLLPPINMEMGNGLYKEDNKKPENLVKIKEGQVQQGVFDKDIFSKPSKGIVHTIFRDYGPKDTVNFIDSMQNTIEQFLVYNGFSVGISDLIADDKTRDDMAEVVKKRKAAIENILLQIHLDLFDNNTGKTNQQEFEDKVFAELNKATEESGKIGLSALSAENRLVAMVRAGSKGSTINISQMMACVGQQAPEGRRIPYGFTDRTLPHFKKYDDGAEARGFVESSFIQGLTPQEFFFHAMSGREGLIDTAVKTADTGYIQRQLVKAMEDLTVQYDGSVRDSRMNVVQFKYGEDGINATKIESASLGLAKLSDAEIRKEFGLEGETLADVLDEGVMRGEDSDALAAFAEQVLADRAMLVEGIQKSRQTGELFTPVNLERALTNVAISFNLNPKEGRTDLTPSYVLAGIERLIERTQTYHKLWAALLRFNLAPHVLIKRKRFTRKAFDTVCEMIITKNWQSWVQPGEQVGIIAAQSIGEPSTQMTLNSVDWDTRIIIARDGRIWTPEIGEFIDNYYETCPDESKIQRLPNGQIYIPLEDGHDWRAISCDEDGKMVWTKLEAITRHPVVNEDGTDTILEVELESGRSVKATKGKSFLTLQEGKLLHTNGSDLKVGDALPIGNTLALEQLGLVKELGLREILPATEYLYGTDALAALDEMQHSGDRHWFQKNQGTKFTVPYARSDSFRDAFEGGRNSNAPQISAGCVYPKRTREDVSQIPETIPLTREFGFFVGAYLAEGMANSTQIHITNNDETYLGKVKAQMDTWNVGTHTVSEQREAEATGIKGTSSSLIIHSTILARVMREQFGRVSYEKHLPDWVLQAPDEFLKGLVDAYISGDGCVSKDHGDILFSSVSKKLIEGMQAVLARYGIFSTMSSYMPELRKFKSVSRSYNIRIPVKYSNIFHDTFTLSIGYKQDILDAHHIPRKGEEYPYKRPEFNDMIMDKIKSIKEIRPMKDGWVYDVTVESTRNFMTYSMIGCVDTFHLAGVAAKSNVTRGVPRLKELLKVTQNPKAISLTVPLKPEYRESREKARKVAQDLELTLLKDIVVKAAIYYDPDDGETVLAEDRDLIKFYKAFEGEVDPVDRQPEQRFGDEDMAETIMNEEPTVWSRLMLRLELDRERMFQKNITMDDIAYVLRTKFGNAINLIYSDYNSQKLIMRVRIPSEMASKSSESIMGTDISTVDDMMALKRLQNRLLTGIVVRGVLGIKAVTFRQDKDVLELDPEEGKYKQLTQYVLDTDGTNFLAVMNHPYVDGTRVTSSHVHDIYENLGIEATRSTLIQEITTLFEEAGVNNRHLGLLCDVMTRAGRLMSVDRYGINKMDIGPLAKASFEETEKILLHAALFGEMDPVTGISANIMMGQPIRGGTGFFNLLFDEQAFMRLQKGLPPTEEGEEEEEEPEPDAPTQEQINAELYEGGEDLCSTARLRMNVTMPQMSSIIEEPDVEIALLDEEEDE